MLLLIIHTLLAVRTLAARYDERETNWNLNTNKQAQDFLQYSGEWGPPHHYTASPGNWRFPFYSLFLDRFVNGDPANDDINGTLFESDPSSNQLRHGGDIAGLVDSLDYLQSMGIEGIYIIGTPFLNKPYKYDQYSPLDFTILDHHFGTIAEWQAAIEEIHSRHMYVLLDVTGSTMADLLAFRGYLNETVPFKQSEHDVEWKSDLRYLDFSFGNTYNESCEYPRFWNETGNRVLSSIDPEFAKLHGCYESDFDQANGDTEAFGQHPDWQRQLSRFASVQDRLREWVPSIRQKIEHSLCLLIAQLDVDGFRFDKATQMTVDAAAEISASIRKCARRYGKNNFFLPGEITGGNTFGSIYLGRGREPEMVPPNISAAVLTTSSDRHRFIRDEGLQALDAAAFHYSMYRTFTRFLGMDGNLSAGYDVPDDFVDIWNTMLTTNDFINANTDEFDPRHMIGSSNQDVFRWPAIADGTDRMLLALFISTLHIPGIPLLLWGEEQAFYILDSTADNYIYGRQPISSALSWQAHGCFTQNSTVYTNWPVDAALRGCNDDSVSLDHRDPTHPVRNIIKLMYHLRKTYSVLQDGFNLQSVAKSVHDVFLPGSYGTPTVTGIWSVVRNHLEMLQQPEGGNQSVWLVYHNEDHQVKYNLDCTHNDTAFIAPFPEGTTVKNILAPYEEFELQKGPGKKLFIDKSQEVNGCAQELTLDAWGFKAYVPKKAWIKPPPFLTSFHPGHDARLRSTPELDVELHFSEKIDCDDVTASITISSKTKDGSVPKLDTRNIACQTMPPSKQISAYIASTWRWKARLTGVADGIHTFTLKNTTGTDTIDHLMVRVGQPDNPVVFSQDTTQASHAYIRDSSTGDLTVIHTAAGADSWRYSTNWGSLWSPWLAYAGGNTTITELPWSGTHSQRWSGHHVILQYWSQKAGSIHIQHADATDRSAKQPRRFPHLFTHGTYNMFGYDGGLPTRFTLDAATGVSKFHLSTEWPTEVQLNVWGTNPDGKPDQTFVYGDVDEDKVLDRVLPDSLSPAVLNITDLPPSPHLAYRIEVHENRLRYELVPAGSRIVQIIFFSLLWVLPILTGTLATWIYMGAFYKIKFNKIGNRVGGTMGFFRKNRTREKGFQRLASGDQNDGLKLIVLGALRSKNESSLTTAPVTSKRRCILIATLEYDIEDWGIKIKIGGLGVMAQLMGKALTKQDLIWVVPCVGGIDYPIDQVAPPMRVTVLGQSYEISVQYHQFQNITYVLLDAPIFRQQSKTEPYPPRMDDLDSAVYYSAWNACIAQTAERFPQIDIYHINDYHGAAAPLYLLPKTIPCCLSLHNAEFQGLWPMRTKQEQEEVCSAYNLSEAVVRKYVQFGGVFNLLHAGASYLRVHQDGFGAVGVSNKYGPRSYARYPIFWALREIGKLPNPDPSDTEPWDEAAEAKKSITVDPEFEAARGDLRKQAQEWAGLKIDPNAELFVFVGRWSVQKGVDLIADVFPAVLEKHPNTQLICIGPVIDLYGKFAALKLEAIMKKYPGRVFSKPEFTQLPPYIFSGAEFALIPSRDEPFGLVAVEFGRKGALGVGARVGGLGQMPGWWFTVESTSSKHLIHQFKAAIDDALGSSQKLRSGMRAQSAKQRFPVARWVEDLEILHSASIRIHEREKRSGKGLRRRTRPSSVDGGLVSSYIYEDQEQAHTEEPIGQAGGISRSLSLGHRAGPGHKVAISPGDRLADVGEIAEEDSEFHMTVEEVETAIREDHVRDAARSLEGQGQGLQAQFIFEDDDMETRDTAYDPQVARMEPPSSEREHTRLMAENTGSAFYSPSLSRSPSPARGRPSLLPGDALRNPRTRSTASLLSLNDVTSGRRDYSLQQVDSEFRDSTGEYYQKFQTLLQQLDAKSSEHGLVIEEYLKEAEKEWASRYRAAKLGRSTPVHSRPASRDASPAGSLLSNEGSTYVASLADEFMLGHSYVRPTVLKRCLQTRIFDWPVYTIFLALGQILAANSYQLVLLTGGSTQGEATKIYVVGSIYVVASCLWWAMFRTMSARWVTSIPFAFYGLAFIIIGLAPLVPVGNGRQWTRNVATGLYSTASASGSLYFALNFGDEGGAPIRDWVFRACIVQGIQQLYVVVLFYWGNALNRSTAAGMGTESAIANKPILAAITCPIGAVLLGLGVLLFTSLPSYYRQTPGKIPHFYHSLLRRRLILWMLVAVTLQNYFLSAPYGRNWHYLWSSTYAPRWAIAILAVIFFVGVWSAIMVIFARLSLAHPWILPIFSFGLLAPRFAQMWWATSSYGLWLPWMPGGPVAGAIAGRAVWLWLGVLDSVQGVGIGMALLQTLTRIHVAVVLVAAQIVGATVTMIAKATAPDRDSPAPVFPDLSAGVVSGLMHPWLWVALAAQLIIPAGFFVFFRKDQINKP